VSIPTHDVVCFNVSYLLEHPSTADRYSMQYVSNTWLDWSLLICLSVCLLVWLCSICQ